MVGLWLSDVLVQQKNHCNWDGEWALKAAPGSQNVDMILDHQKVLKRNHSSNVISGSEENEYFNKIFCCWPSMILEEGLSHNISRRRIIKLQRLRLSFHPFFPALTTPPTAIKRTNNCWDVVIKVGQVGDIECSWYRIPWPLLNSKTKKNSNDVNEVKMTKK